MCHEGCCKFSEVIGALERPKGLQDFHFVVVSYES